jgi:hypothetical protein
VVRESPNRRFFRHLGRGFLAGNQRGYQRVDGGLASHLAGIRGISMLIGALVTFLVVILILYLVNLLPLDGRAKQIVRVVVIILGVISLLKYIAVF